MLNYYLQDHDKDDYQGPPPGYEDNPHGNTGDSDNITIIDPDGKPHDVKEIDSGGDGSPTIYMPEKE